MLNGCDNGNQFSVGTIAIAEEGPAKVANKEDTMKSIKKGTYVYRPNRLPEDGRAFQDAQKDLLRSHSPEKI